MKRLSRRTLLAASALGGLASLISGCGSTSAEAAPMSAAAVSGPLAAGR